MILIGDVHGQWQTLAERIRDSGVRGQDLIQVGDFGLGFDNPRREHERLTALDGVLSMTENTLHVIRGNHDNPAYWRPDYPWRRRAIRLLPDYTMATLRGAKMLFVGGAISVDRMLRRRNESYWPDEGLVLDEERLATLDLEGLWAVVTHTAPDLAPPYAFDAVVYPYLAVDHALHEDLVAERRRATTLYEQVRARTAIPRWFYGHYHHHATHEHDGTQFALLDIMEWVEA